MYVHVVDIISISYAQFLQSHSQGMIVYDDVDSNDGKGENDVMMKAGKWGGRGHGDEMNKKWGKRERTKVNRKSSSQYYSLSC